MDRTMRNDLVSSHISLLILPPLNEFITHLPLLSNHLIVQQCVVSFHVTAAGDRCGLER